MQCHLIPQNLWRVGKNYGPILSRLWVKVQKILRRYRGPRSFRRPCLIIYVMFCSDDICH